MNEMKAAMYYSQQDIRIEEIPVPEIADDEVLVEMKACGVCGSDLMDWYLEDRAPLVLGHEPAGVIARKGRKVKDFDIGDRVFVHHHVACLTCHYCLHGDYTLCKQFHATNIKPGGFAQYFRVPAPNLHIDTLKIPEKISFDEATLIEPIACCLRAVKKANLRTGDSVAIIGAGATGIIHTKLCRLFGASRIIVSDIFDYRLDVSRRSGADVVVNPEREDLNKVVKAKTGGRGVDLAIVTAPNMDAYRAGISVCRKGGTLVIFAPTVPGKHLELSPMDLFFTELKVIPSYSASHLETREALDLIESGRVDVGDLITHRFGLEDAGEAFKTALRNRDSLKVVLFSR